MFWMGEERKGIVGTENEEGRRQDGGLRNSRQNWAGGGAGRWMNKDIPRGDLQEHV